jgi:hypothetical protein
MELSGINMGSFRPESVLCTNTNIITIIFEYLHPKEQLKFLSLNKRLINYVIFRVSPIQTTLTLYISNFIEDQGMKDRFNQYFIQCRLTHLHNKFSPGEPEPEIYNVLTLNVMLWKSIPNNNGDQGRIDEQRFLIALGAIITHITYDAFTDMQLTGVTIPETVTNIMHRAFYGNQLTKVIIPPSVTYIDIHAFSHNQLDEVEIPPSVTHIGNSAFSDNRLVKVKIPPLVKHITHNVLANNRLVEVEMPHSVTTIGNNAFYNNRLVKVELPADLTRIGENAFMSNQLFKVEITPRVERIGFLAFAYNRLNEVIMPNSDIVIENHAFLGNQLTNYTIGNHNKRPRYV